MTSKHGTTEYTLAFYLGNRKTGNISLVRSQAGKFSVQAMPGEPESNLDKTLKPVLLGMTEDQRVVLLDPKTKALSMQKSFPVDAFPAHIYADPTSNRDWFMNDGDKETGNDSLNCGDKGSSVTVVENTGSSQAKFLKTICVGRGHHQACFTAPSKDAPHVPHLACISNLKDGTVTLIGNNPKDTQTYLNVIGTIILGQADKEDNLPAGGVPNNAFPHGLAYSPLTGKLYNLNNGYGNISIIDPVTQQIEKIIPFKGHSNLFAVPGGRYLIGRGADRKSDPEHVIGKLSVFDVTTNSIAGTLELRDIYISKYYFNADASKLYLTTGSSGSPEQVANLKPDVLLCIELKALPKLTLSKELKVGSSGSLELLNDQGRTAWLFSSDSEGGRLVVIDAERDEVAQTLTVTSGGSHSRVWRVGV